MKRYLKSKLDRLDKIKNKQHDNDETFKMTKEVRISILIKRNETFIKKKKSGLCHNFKEIRIKIIISNIYKTREIIIYKRLS